MHRLTSSRMKWGQGALLAGTVLGAVYLSFTSSHSHRGPASGPVPLMTIATRLSPEQVSRSGSRSRWDRLVSPDRKWALDCSIRLASECHVTAQDGSRRVTRTWPQREFWTSASNVIWTPDSRSWVGLLAGERSLYAVVQ